MQIEVSVGHNAVSVMPDDDAHLTVACVHDQNSEVFDPKFVRMIQIPELSFSPRLVQRKILVVNEPYAFAELEKSIDSPHGF